MLGLGSALALPPVGFVPALFGAFAVLVWMLDGARTWRAAFAVGWWFGFGHFTAGTFWIANVFLFEASHLAWLIPPTVLAIPACMAVYPALALTLTQAVRPGWARIAALAVAWTALEMLRGIGPFGFPWNPIGSVWTDIPAMMQPASVVGVHGLTLLTLALAASCARLVEDERYSVALGVALALGLIWGGGALRLGQATGDVHPGVTLGIVQANIPQHEKHQETLRDRNFTKHLHLSEAALEAGATHLIWPETAIDHLISRAFQVAQAVPEDKWVISGVMRFGPIDANPLKVWNSLMVLDGKGHPVASYDKSRLVPFGEYAPLRRFLPFTQFLVGSLDYSRGAGAQTLHVPGVPPFSPLICYEIIFSGQVTDPDARPEWILNISNDGWFGDSNGPYQHFAAARMRAVEEGLPVVRAANTGISAIIDPYGRVMQHIAMGQE